VIESLEAVLENKLSRLRTIKRRLEELEKEESELSQFNEVKGTVVEKYVRCGREGCKSCPHGPYYYLVWKEDGRTKWKYLGKSYDKKVLEARERLAEIRKEKRRLLKLAERLVRT